MSTGRVVAFSLGPPESRTQGMSGPSTPVHKARESPGYRRAPRAGGIVPRPTRRALASILLAAAKLDDVEPLAYLEGVPKRLSNGNQ
jgi:hypothetical protein